MRRTIYKEFLIDTLYYIAGSALLALGVYTFALNAHFATGGITGVSIIINHYTGWPIGTLSLVLNIPLIILGFFTLGRAFMLKSLWAMLFNTLFLDVIFPRFPSYTGSPLVAAIFTGACMGAGLALVYMRGSSTGGSDFVTMSIKKRRPHYSVGQISLVIDGAVILAGGAVFGNIDAVLYGIVSVFASTTVIDRILYGAGSSRMALIITSHGAEIAGAIGAEIGRGSTLLRGTGTYTGAGRDILYCVCSKNEIVRVRNIVRAIDPGSMFIVTEASEVFGQGFKPPRLPGNEDPPPKNR